MLQGIFKGTNGWWGWPSAAQTTTCGPLGPMLGGYGVFGAGAVDTLFGEENMVGETTAAPMSWDASGVPSPGAVFPSPGPSPVVVTKRQRGRATDLPTACSPGLRARGLGL